MSDSIFSEMLSARARSPRVRLRTLVTLRWLAVAGQWSAVAVANQVLGMPLPVLLCALVTLASVAVNVVTLQVYPANARLSDRAAMWSMLFDVGQVSVLLFLTGGLSNPFAVLLLAPVTVSASALSLRSAGAVAAVALAASTALAFWHMPLILPGGDRLQLEGIYLFGMWSALAIGMVFMAVYARRIAVENYRMNQALQAAQRALSSEQRLTAIGGLAAAAAHELGTPLATIKLVSAELADELEAHPALREDAELIRKQADRCRDILADLRHGGRADEHVKRAPISALVEEAAEPHADRGARIVIRIDGAPLDEAPAPLAVRRQPEIVHGLRNLVQNAVDFAETTIWIDLRQEADRLRINVGDDGPGYPADLLARLGDPYVSSRPRDARTERGQGEYKGMGLGLFIAKTLLERTGARVSFANADRAVRRANRGLPMERRAPTGAVAAVVWPLASLDAIRDDGRGPLGLNQRFTVDTI